MGGGADGSGTAFRRGAPSKIRRCVVEWLGVRIVIAWVVLWDVKDLIRWSSCYGMRAVLTVYRVVGM